jgi:hypothetical protein
MQILLIKINQIRELAEKPQVHTRYIQKILYGFGQKCGKTMDSKLQILFSFSSQIQHAIIFGCKPE